MGNCGALGSGPWSEVSGLGNVLDPGRFIFDVKPTQQMQSWYELIQEHLEKIEQDPNSQAVEHWRGEIRSWARQILNKAQQVTKGRRTDALEKYLQRTLGTSVEDLTKMLRTPIIVINPCLLNPRLAGCQSRGPMM